MGILHIRLWFEGWVEDKFEGGLKRLLTMHASNQQRFCVDLTWFEAWFEGNLINVATPLVMPVNV